jgi:hypothetical protein
MDMKEANKSSEKFILKNSLTLEELHKIMSDAEMPGKFKLKKGLFGKSITFDVYMQIQPRITIKENVVTVRKIKSSSTVSVGDSPEIDFKDMKERIGAVKEGASGGGGFAAGLKKAALGGQEYFLGVCNSVREVLAPYTE